MFRIIEEVGLGKFFKAGVAEIYRKIIRESLFNSYSQDWEDIKIDKLLNYQKKGFYVEIGGYDPIRLSNTYRFYKKGWRGVVVEPNPEVANKFLEIRPRDKFINAGIGLNDGHLDYYKYLIPALNTFSKEAVLENKMKGFEVSEIVKIKILGVKDFLQKYAREKIDFLSIDTEGMDYEILKNWNWQFTPNIICVEKDGENKIKGLMKKKEYKLVRETKYNLILVSI